MRCTDSRKPSIIGASCSNAGITHWPMALPRLSINVDAVDNAAASVPANCSATGANASTRRPIHSCAVAMADGSFSPISDTIGPNASCSDPVAAAMDSCIPCGSEPFTVSNAVESIVPSDDASSGPTFSTSCGIEPRAVPTMRPSRGMMFPAAVTTESTSCPVSASRSAFSSASPVSQFE